MLVYKKWIDVSSIRLFDYNCAHKLSGVHGVVFDFSQLVDRTIDDKTHPVVVYHEGVIE